MTVYALRLNSGTDTAARVRMADLLALPAGSSPLTGKSAVRADGGGVVSVVEGTMDVQVARFIAWVQGSVSVAQGGYPFVCDASVTLTLAAGHSTLARTDTIVGVVRDNTFDASGSVDARVIVVQGVPGAGAPALPGNCVALRDVVVPPGLSAGNGGLQAAHLGTDRRRYLAPTAAAVTSSEEFRPTTAPTDVPGMAVTVAVSNAAAVHRVDISFDVERDGLNSPGMAFVGLLSVDGTPNSAQVVYQVPSTGRSAVAKTYLVAGLAAGQHTFKARAFTTGGSDYIVHTPHATMVVTQVA